MKYLVGWDANVTTQTVAGVTYSIDTNALTSDLVRRDNDISIESNDLPAYTGAFVTDNDFIYLGDIHEPDGKVRIRRISPDGSISTLFAALDFPDEDISMFSSGTYVDITNSAFLAFGDGHLYALDMVTKALTRLSDIVLPEGELVQDIAYHNGMLYVISGFKIYRYFFGMLTLVGEHVPLQTVRIIGDGKVAGVSISADGTSAYSAYFTLDETLVLWEMSTVDGSSVELGNVLFSSQGQLQFYDVV